MNRASPADKYAACLKVINFISFAFGVTMIGLGVYSLQAPEGAAVRLKYSWAIIVFVAFGTIMTVISCLGCYGAGVAKSRIGTGSTNWALVIYWIILLGTILAQLYAAAVVLSLNGTIANANAQTWSNSTMGKFEHDLTDYFDTHKSEWIDIQNQMDCCGYGSLVDNLATGSACDYNTTVTTPATLEPSVCRDKFLNKAESALLAIGLVAIFLVLVEVCAIVSTCCLCCCITQKEQADYAHLHQPHHATARGYAGAGAGTERV